MMAGAKRNPYHSLRSVSGINHRDPAIRALAETALAVQQIWTDRTFVTKDEVGDHLDVRQEPGNVWLRQVLAKEVAEEIKRRVLSGLEDNAIFHVVSETGDEVYGSVAALFRETHAMQAVGNHVPDERSVYSKRRKASEGLNVRHDDVIAEVIDCPDGGLVIDTASGSNYDRISRLYKAVSNRGGALVCHDVCPAAAQAAKEHIPDIPYLVLPALREEVAGPFRDFEGPKILAANDLLSTIAFGELQALFEFAKATGVDRVVASQSMMFAPSSSFIPDYFRPDEPQFIDFIGALMREDVMSLDKSLIMKLKNDVFGRAPDPVGGADSLLMGIYLREQIRHIVLLMVTEIVRIHFCNFAKQYLGYKVNTSLVEESRIIENGRDYIETAYPDTLRWFDDGTFNTIVISPFSTNYEKRPGISSGQLQLVDLRYVMEASADPKGKIPKTEGRKVKMTGPTKTITPKEFSHFDPLHVASIVLQDAQHKNLGDVSGILRRMRANKNFTALALRIASDLIFNRWTNDPGYRDLTNAERKRVKGMFT